MCINMRNNMKINRNKLWIVGACFGCLSFLNANYLFTLVTAITSLIIMGVAWSIEPDEK